MPGCPRLAVKRGRCEEHQRSEVSTRERGSASERGYGSDWRVLRAEYLRENPDCVGVVERGVRIHAAGCDGTATEVDHVVPRRLGGSDDWENLQALSRRCHARKTATQDGGYGNSRGG